MEGLSHAVVSNLTKGGEGRFGCYSAEAWVGIERLEELRGPHGFGETEDAARMIVRDEEVEPLMDVVALEEAVGGELAATGAVGASVGKEHVESVRNEELGVTGHADAVIALAMEEYYGITVFVTRTNFPSAKSCAVGGGEGNVGKFGFERSSGLAKFGNLIFDERASGRMKRAVSEVDAADCAENQVKDDSEEEPAGETQHGHSLMEATGFGVGRFQEKSKPLVVENSRLNQNPHPVAANATRVGHRGWGLR